MSETIARYAMSRPSLVRDSENSLSARELILKRRQTKRYDLALPVLFSWNDSLGNVHKQGGFSRNIGTHGLYVIGDVAPPLGALLQVEVLLPLAFGARLNSAKQIAAMRVSRVYEGQQVRGFAAVGDFNQSDVISEIGNLAKPPRNTFSVAPDESG
jgi:hypothetical protein